MEIKLAIDTRQQEGKHEIKHNYFEEKGIKAFRTKVPFGDYALLPSRSVDTKQDIYELAQDIDHDHQRFKAEILNARDFGCQLTVLVENRENIKNLFDLSQWKEPYDHLYMRRMKNQRAKLIEGQRLARACATMHERYGVIFEFCAPEEAPQKILEILSDGLDKT